MFDEFGVKVSLLWQRDLETVAFGDNGLLQGLLRGSRPRFVEHDKCGAVAAHLEGA
jgi:hypothetical protein